MALFAEVARNKVYRIVNVIVDENAIFIETANGSVWRLRLVGNFGCLNGKIEPEDILPWLEMKSSTTYAEMCPTLLYEEEQAKEEFKALEEQIAGKDKIIVKLTEALGEASDALIALGAKSPWPSTAQH